MDSPNQLTLSKYLVGAAASLLLTACGGGGGGSTPASTPTPTPTSVELSGTVADGYLENATVCLDINNNSLCDTDEPSAISGANGSFTLEATQAEIDSAPLLVKAIAGTTIDADNPGVPITKDYTMSAPTGYTFVSPVTTMVQGQIELNSLSLADAETAVQTAMNTTADPSLDYEELSATDPAYEQVKQIAQVTAIVLADNLEAVSTAAEIEGATLTVDQLVDLIVDKVLAALAVISVNVETATTFDATVIATSTEVSDEALVDTTLSIGDQVAVQEANEAQVVANIADVVKSTGISWVDGWFEGNGMYEWDYGTFSYDETSQTTSDVEYAWNGAAFIAISPTPDVYELTANGWELSGDSLSVTALNSDGTFDIAIKTPSGAQALKENVSGTQIDLADLNLGAQLLAYDNEAWAPAVAELATFSAGAVGYKLTFTVLEDQYEFFEWDCQTPAATGGICNAAWLMNGDGDYGTDGNALSLASLVSDPAAVQTTAEADPSQLKAVHIGFAPNNIVLAAELVAGGVVNFYQVDFNAPAAAAKLASGTWSQSTVHTKEIIEFAVPTTLMDQFDMNDESNITILATVDGYVRMGQKMIAGSSQQDLAFNNVALDDLIGSFTDINPAP